MCPICCQLLNETWRQRWYFVKGGLESLRYRTTKQRQERNLSSVKSHSARKSSVSFGSWLKAKRARPTSRSVTAFSPLQLSINMLEVLISLTDSVTASKMVVASGSEDWRGSDADGISLPALQQS